MVKTQDVFFFAFSCANFVIICPVFRWFFLHRTRSIDRSYSIRVIDFHFESLLSAPTRNHNLYPLGPQLGKRSAKTEANYFIPRTRLLWPKPARANRTRKGRRCAGICKTCPSIRRQYKGITVLRERLPASSARCD